MTPEQLTPRKIAQRNGDLMYEGRPCVNGHSGLRYTSTGGCPQCSLDWQREFRRNATPEQRTRIREQDRKTQANYRNTHKEDWSAYQKQYQATYAPEYRRRLRELNEAELQKWREENDISPT